MAGGKSGPRPGRANPSRDGGGKFGGVFSRELGQRIVRGVAAGLFDSQNALLNGVHPDTIKSWVARGLAEDADPAYRDFAEAYVKESIETEKEQVEFVLQADDWRARAWWLERRFPRRWKDLKDNLEPRDALKLPEANESRSARSKQMINNPSPELIQAFREAGWDLVKREQLPAPPSATTEEKDNGDQKDQTEDERNEEGQGRQG